MSAQQVPAEAAAVSTANATRATSRAPASEAPRIPKLELFWMLFVFPSLLFLSICVLTQQHTGHKFRHSVHYVLIGLQHAEVWPWVLVGAGVGLLSPFLQLLISEKGMRFFNFVMQLSLAPFLTMASGLIAFECHLRDLTHEETLLLSGAANAASFFFLPLLTSWSRISKWWRNRSTPKLD